MQLQVGCMNRPWGQFTLDEALAGIAAAGYKTVQFCAQQGAHLIRPDSTDEELGQLRAKLDQVIDEFIDPEFRVLEEDDWLLMALRHSIFSQGGPALGDMTESERNLSGHAQHSGGGRASIPGMGSGPF